MTFTTPEQKRKDLAAKRQRRLMRIVYTDCPKTAPAELSSACVWPFGVQSKPVKVIKQRVETLDALL